MKEILFRGKVADEPNEWVYGSLVNDDTIFQRKAHDGSKACDMGMFKVDPETVGQFTGLSDKSGKKIFEGDIVKEWSIHWKTPLKTEINIYEVVCENLGSLHLIRKTEYGETSTLLYRKSVVVVIGNIFDNPELLEEKQ